MCAQITRSAVEALLRARASLLPLADAAAFAGLDPVHAQTWLADGRHWLAFPAAHNRRPPHAALTVPFAREWDRAGASYITTLREVMLEHARKDPRVAAQLLAQVEDDYQRKQLRETGMRGVIDAELARVGGAPMPDLEERFAPLGVTIQPERTLAARSVTRTPDGTTTTTEVTSQPVAVAVAAWEVEMETRSTTDLDFYAQHGMWPEEAPRTLEAAIDAQGEDVTEGDAEIEDGLGTDPASAAELAAGLNGLRYAEAAAAGVVPLQKVPALEIRELPQGEVIEDPEPAEEPAAAPVPAFRRLARIDPFAGR